MIRNWKIENFKSIYNLEDGELYLTPLTIFCGANSSGKSSIIQSILLVAQTLQTTTTSRPVVLNGHLVRLGSFDDIHSTGAETNTTTIGFGLDEIDNDSSPFYIELVSSPSFAYDNVFTRFTKLDKTLEAITRIECNFSFSANGPKRDRDLLQLHPRIEQASVAAFIDQDWLGETISLADKVAVRRSNQTPRQRLASHPLAKKLYNPKYPPHPSSKYVGMDYEVTDCSNIPMTSKQTSAQLAHFFPEHLGAIYEHEEEIAKQLERAAPHVPEEFLDTGYIPDGQDISNMTKSEFDAHFSAYFSPLYPETKAIILEILAELASKAEAELAGMVEEEKGVEQTADESEHETLQASMDQLLAIRAVRDLNEEEIKQANVLLKPQEAQIARLKAKLRANEYSHLIKQLENLSQIQQLEDLYYAAHSFRSPTPSAEELAILFTPQDWWRLYHNLQFYAQEEIAHAFFNKAAQIRTKSRTQGKGKATVDYSGVPAMSGFAIEYIRKFFNFGVKYLGPLRDEPRTVYPLIGAADPRDVGLRGEHTAAVLQVHRNTKVNYIPSRLVATGQEPIEIAEVPLFQAVQEWLDYLGVATDLKSIDSGNLGHRLKVSSAGSSSLHDLTHVGVGVSQVLPILVMAFLAEPGSTLIFEQPELHLHPRVQTRLADFFASMTLSGRQCIIETHSEYLINRLRYLTALSDSETLTNSTLVYFVEKQEGQSTFRPITINRFGAIDDWPHGFFDESEEIAAEILKATISKRKRERENGSSNA